MTKNTKTINQILVAIVGGNAFVFLLLSYLQKLSTDPKDLVFIDFWGRLCVYSLWFVGYAAYRQYIYDNITLRKFIIGLVCLNIPLFLLLGYFDKLSTTAVTLPFIDFWGRLTVYSLWFMGYEFYREFMLKNELTTT